MSDPLQQRKLCLIFLSGAGGVGKTSVANTLQTEGEKLDLKVVCTKSTTRQSYAKCGVSDETACANLSAANQTHLQDTIFYDYCANLEASIAKAIEDEQDILVVDRSPYDHASYMFQLIPTLELEFIEKRMKEVKVVMEALTHKHYSNRVVTAIEPQLWLFEYPTSWAKTQASEDGFRYAPHAKNFIWHLALKAMLLDFRMPGEVMPVRTFRPYDLSTPLERAHRILGCTSLTKHWHIPSTKP